MARAERLQAEFAERSLSDYRVAYLGAADAPFARSVLNHEAFTLTFIHSAEDFTEWLADGTPNALLVDRSAMAWLDVEQVRAVYREGTGLITIGMRFEEHADLSGDFCTVPVPNGDPAANDPTQPNAFDETTLFATVFVFRGDQLTEEERRLSIDALLTTCEHFPIEREVPRGRSIMYHIVDVTPDDHEVVINLLKDYAGREEFKLILDATGDEIFRAWRERQP